MRGALTHFAGQRSQHPVGRKFTGASAYTDTQGEYLSSYLSNTADEMDCLDCHDERSSPPAAYYMAHRTTPPRTTRTCLRSVTVDGQYDALCRTCHGASAGTNWKSKGKDIRVTSHVDGAVGKRAGRGRRHAAAHERPRQGRHGGYPDQPVRGLPRGPRLPQRQALHERLRQRRQLHGVPPRRRPLRQLHQAQPRQGPLSNYQYGGVFMDMAMPCTDCHIALDVSTTNLAGTRKKHIEKIGSRSTATGHLQEELQPLEERQQYRPRHRRRAIRSGASASPATPWPRTRPTSVTKARRAAARTATTSTARVPGPPPTSS